MAIQREKRKHVDLSGMSVIEMPVRPTLGIILTGHNINDAGLLTPLGIILTGHNINDAGLLTPLGVGTIVTKVTKVIMGVE